MAKRKYKTDLSTDGINNVIQELKNYRNNVLIGLIDEALSQIIDKGIAVANTRKGDFTSFISFEKKLDREQYGVTGIMLGYNTATNESIWYTSEGEKKAVISSILMAEFGSGIHAENTLNIEQKGHRGTFPNQTHAFERYWYYATKLDDNGRPSGWVKTDGIEPTTPMYWASMEMQDEISNVFRSVFK